MSAAHGHYCKIAPEHVLHADRCWRRRRAALDKALNSVHIATTVCPSVLAGVGGCCRLSASFMVAGNSSLNSFIACIPDTSTCRMHHTLPYSSSTLKNAQVLWVMLHDANSECQPTFTVYCHCRNDAYLQGLGTALTVHTNPNCTLFGCP